MNEYTIPSYPSIYAVGHRNMKPLQDVEVIIEEKIDGSQATISVDEYGNRFAKSKSVQLNVDMPEKMFSLLITTLTQLHDKLNFGWLYRGEFLNKPKHNTLAYDRTPKFNFILFDIEMADGTFLSRAQKEREAARLGLEIVPVLYRGAMPNAEQFLALMNTRSILGGQNVEGVVVKPADYNVWGVDKKLVLAKYVSESFKEVHRGKWKEGNPSNSDIIEQIAAQYCTPARWDKAVHHLRDEGKLEGSPKDISKLIVEVKNDVQKEEEQSIKDALFQYAWPKIQRQLVAGFPEWYKEKLVKESLG